MSAPLLEWRSADLGYFEKTVVAGVDLAVRAGESVALLGVNGCGKTTLLQSAVRGSRIHAGALWVDGRNQAELSFRELAQRIAFVPQSESTPYAFTAREIVLLGRIAQSFGLYDTLADEAAADSAMALADCAAYASRPITELSGGERQRVLIARALAQGSPVLILDEPTSSLDVAHQLAVAAIVRSHATRGGAAIMAVHDLNLAARFADRAVLMQDGRIRLDAPIFEVLNSPILDEVYGVRFARLQTDGITQLVAAPSG